MRRRLRPLGLVGLLALIGVAGAVSANSAAPASVWGKAIKVPGMATLNSGANGYLNSVSCAATGDCAAGGYYWGTGSTHQAFVVDEVNGRWHKAIEVPGTALLNSGGYAQVTEVSCAAVGDCAASGFYYTGDPDSESSYAHAFVVNRTNGRWGKAIEVPGTAALLSAGVYSVSCGAAGDCAAGGSYADGSNQQALVVSETNGRWHKAIEVPGTAALNLGGHAVVSSVSCGAVRACAAGGWYTDGSGHRQAFVANEKNGVWHKAIEVPGTALLNSGGDAWVYSVSCAAAGNCAAGGRYLDGSGRWQAFVVSETNGVWGDAIEVPGTAALNSGGQAEVYSVSCGAARACAAGGWYTDGSGHLQAWVANETHGRWHKAVEVPGTAALNSGHFAVVGSVSCAAAGDCAAGGSYTAGSDNYQAFVVKETNGVWGNAIVVPGTAVLNRGDNAQADSVSCAAVGECAAVGWYVAQSGPHAFVVSSTLPRLHAGRTTCNGMYTGTGRYVRVPSGDTCTLVPGSDVTSDVTVDAGGTLIAKGVNIGGDLTIAGGAKVCHSRVAGDITAASAQASLTLGGRSCQRGNTFLNDVIVKNDNHDVWIQGNHVAGDLVVLNNHGAPSSIVRNTVRNLLVANSGPVVLKDNRAASTMLCKANHPQKGSGNSARGKNTCPR